MQSRSAYPTWIWPFADRALCPRAGDLKLEAQQQRADLQKSAERNDELEEKIVEARRESAQVWGDAHKRQRDFQKTECELKEAKQKNKQLEQSMASSMASVSELSMVSREADHRAIADAEDQMRTALERMTKLNADNTVLQASTTKLQVELSKSKHELSKTKGDLSETKSKLSDAKTECFVLTKAVASLEAKEQVREADQRAVGAGFQQTAAAFDHVNKLTDSNAELQVGTAPVQLLPNAYHT